MRFEMLWQFSLWYISLVSQRKWIHMQLTDLVFSISHVVGLRPSTQSVLLLVCHVTFVPSVFLLVVVVFNCAIAV